MQTRKLVGLGRAVVSSGSTSLADMGIPVDPRAAEVELCPNGEILVGFGKLSKSSPAIPPHGLVVSAEQAGKLRFTARNGTYLDVYQRGFEDDR